MKKISIKTSGKEEVIDITDLVNKQLKKEGEESGICNLFVLHTTCALTCMDLDPGTDLDLLETINKTLAKIKFRHAHNPAHTPDHIKSAILGTSLNLPFESRELILGTWQRVVLLEFAGPREREVVITLIAN